MKPTRNFLKISLGIALLILLFSKPSLNEVMPASMTRASAPTSCTNDTWTATGLTNAPDARASHTAVWTGSEMIVWGGSTSGGYLNTGARYNPASDSWTAISTINAPAARGEHTAVWTGSEMIVWGGHDANEMDTGARYNPATDTWTPISTVNAPSKRRDHTVVWTGSEMIVWGGFSGGRWNRTYFNTGGRYNPASDSWTATGTVNAPAARDGHTAVWTGSEMIVWGGASSHGYILSSGGRYNPATDTWTATTYTNVTNSRYLHTAVWTGSEMIVWGGFGYDTQGATYLDTGGRYRPATDTWTATSTMNAPSLRGYHSAIWTGSEMIIWGGSPNYLQSGGRYNPATDAWRATGTSNVPDGRIDHAVVWTGSEMIIWGGRNSNYLNTGGRYCAPVTSSCSYSISPTNQYFPSSGGSGSLNISTQASCSWIATSNASWVTITSADGGTGNATVTYEVRENFTGSARSATLTIAGQTLTVIQDGGLGGDCSYALSPTSSSFSPTGGTGTINLTTENRCAWEATCNVSWITITSNSSGIGNGTVSYSVAANSGSSGRKATITIAGKTFSVKQK